MKNFSFIHLLQGVFLAAALLLLIAAPAHAMLPADLNAPFAWATNSDREQLLPYSLTGGTGGSIISLVSDGTDMSARIEDVLTRYDIVVLDGSNGDFIFSRSAQIKRLQNKTIVGINGARLCTQFVVTPRIQLLLDSVGVKSMSGTSGTGGTLSNGVNVDEAGELYTRQTLINLFGDPEEKYRKSGIFTIDRCENVVVRNLSFVGPGSVDVGGADLLTCTHTKHMWVDHCSFVDGMDGNLDITQQSDFVSVTWCTFAYTDRSYDHMLSNLIGGSDLDADDNLLNVCFANCVWGEGVRSRTPMVRHGKIHLLNCLWQCAGCHYPINPHLYAEIRIEGCYFDRGVKKIFRSADDAKAWQWVDCTFVEAYAPEDNGQVSMPYTYQAFPSAQVPAVLLAPDGAGPTLSSPLQMGLQSATPDIPQPLCAKKMFVNGMLLIRHAHWLYDTSGRQMGVSEDE